MKYNSLPFVMAAACLLIASCSNEEIGTPAQQSQKEIQYHIGQETSFDDFMQQFEMLKDVIESMEEGEEKENLKKNLDELMESLKSLCGDFVGENGNTSSFSVRTDTIIYPTTDCNGGSISLSGFIHYPMSGGKIPFDEIEGMVINCHATKPQGVAIEEIAQAFGDMKIDLKKYGLGDVDKLINGIYTLKQLTADGVIVLEPDYEGFGCTSDRPQTYLCQKLIAKQCADMIQPVLDLTKKMYGKDITDNKNFSSYIVGYSQGGGQALALTRYLTVEDKPLLEKINLVNSVCGAGPYDPQLTFHTWLERKEIGMSVLLPMVLSGYMAGHPDIMKYDNGNTIDIKSYFSDKYNNYPEEGYGIPQRVKNMDNGFTQGMGYDIKNGKVWGVVAHKVPILDLMSDEAKNSDSYIMQALDSCLRMEQVCYDWTPVTSVILLSTEFDNIVPVDNTHKAYEILHKKAGNLVSKVIAKNAYDHVLGQVGYTTTLITNQLYKKINKK